LQINPIAFSLKQRMAMATDSEPLGFPQRDSSQTGGGYGKRARCL
jgi:hypothetical protein